MILIFHKKFTKLLSVVLLISLVFVFQPAFAHTTGFKDDYDPSKWDQTYSNSDGHLDSSGAPGFITFYGGDNQSGTEGDSDLTIFIQCEGKIKFKWTFDGEPVTGSSGPGFDPSGYLIDGEFHQLTNDAGPEVQSNSETIDVKQGSTFGFRIHSVDNIVGPGIFVKIENFEAPLCIGPPQFSNIYVFKDDEVFLSEPFELDMTEELAEKIVIGINQHWPDWKSNLAKIHPCPCKSSNVPNDWERTDSGIAGGVGGLILDWFHPGVDVEFRSPVWAEGSKPSGLVAYHGQQCTYDEFGYLIAELGNQGSGSPDFWGPVEYVLNHHAVDVDTYEQLGYSEYEKTWTPYIPPSCPSKPSISINDISKNEGSKNGMTPFSFTITRQGDLTNPSAVDYATVDGTAIGGSASPKSSSDYVLKSGTVNFAAGVTSSTITITVKQDQTKEQNETFTVNLSNPQGSTISDASGLGTILNDD